MKKKRDVSRTKSARKRKKSAKTPRLSARPNVTKDAASESRIAKRENDYVILSGRSDTKNESAEIRSATKIGIGIENENETETETETEIVIPVIATETVVPRKRSRARKIFLKTNWSDWNKRHSPTCYVRVAARRELDQRWKSIPRSLPHLESLAQLQLLTRFAVTRGRDRN